MYSLTLKKSMQWTDSKFTLVTAELFKHLVLRSIQTLQTNWFNTTLTQIQKSSKTGYKHFPRLEKNVMVLFVIKFDSGQLHPNEH